MMDDHDTPIHAFIVTRDKDGNYSNAKKMPSKTTLKPKQVYNVVYNYLMNKLIKRCN
jgi:hypothetical protein